MSGRQLALSPSFCVYQPYFPLYLQTSNSHTFINWNFSVCVNLKYAVSVWHRYTTVNYHNFLLIRAFHTVTVHPHFVRKRISTIRLRHVRTTIEYTRLYTLWYALPIETAKKYAQQRWNQSSVKIHISAGVW